MPSKARTPIAIIILTWNGLALTRCCIETLHLDNLPDHVSVIVVDNGSTDGSVEYLRSLPRLTLIENGQNLGYARAVNIGSPGSCLPMPTSCS